MSAGFNLKVKVWRFSYPADDVIGGAQPSGTVAYQSLPARIHALEPDQVFLQQGLETTRTFRGTCQNALLYEKDEWEVVYPINHRYYGQRFRVDGVSENNYHPSDARSMLIVNLSRSQRAHASQ